MTAQADDIDLNVAPDHVASLTRCNPIRGIEELIWNALDADANEITIDFKLNDIGGVDTITVSDNGLGFEAETKDATFGFLGNSTKKQKPKTPGGRHVHGKEGKGRFRAFALGHDVEWRTTYKNIKGELVEWKVTGNVAKLTKFPNTKPEPSKAKQTGTVVTIRDVQAGHVGLTSSHARADLLTKLAPYLGKYPSVRVFLDGERLEITSVVEDQKEYDVQGLPLDNGGKPLEAKLRIVEWKIPVERKLYFCTSAGFARAEEAPSIHAKGFDFTAYLMTNYIEGMSDAEVDVSDLRPEFISLREAARDTLRDHFKSREAARTLSVVDRWKQEGIYPYLVEPASPVAQVERDVFEICAMNIREKLPHFDELDAQNKKFTLRLVREALETNPGSLQTILREVLDLPPKQQDELADLLQKHKLGSIIRASKVVTDRLAFIGSLEAMAYDKTLASKLRERSQLHRILVNELWIFGEQFLLGTDDQGMKSVLKQHMKLLGRKELAADTKEVTDKKSIPDLMLYRRYAERSSGEFEHLVIELKAPKVKLGSDEINQIKKYAYAVADEPRFDKEKTKWTFVVVSSDMDKFAKNECKQADREYGHIERKSNLDIHVKTWASLIQDCKWRYEFYRKALEHEAQEGDAMEYLGKKHATYLPKAPSNDHAHVNDRKTVLEPAKPRAKRAKAT